MPVVMAELPLASMLLDVAATAAAGADGERRKQALG